jgi:hypothetical protein
LNARGHNIITFSNAWKLLAFCLLLVVGQPLLAQNTKGDRPVQNRESRFKTPFKKTKSSKKQKVVKAKRVRSSQGSVAGRANASSSRRRASGVDRPGKPIRPVVRNQPSNKQKAWRGDIAGRKIRAGSSAGSSRKNVYPQYGKYTHNPSKKPRSKDRPVSNRGELAVVQGLAIAADGAPTQKKKDNSEVSVLFIYSSQEH